MMKEYVTPELEVIEFDAEDIIQTSLEDGGENGSIGGEGNGGDAGIWSLRPNKEVY